MALLNTIGAPTPTVRASFGFGFHLLAPAAHSVLKVEKMIVCYGCDPVQVLQGGRCAPREIRPLSGLPRFVSVSQEDSEDAERADTDPNFIAHRSLRGRKHTRAA